MSILNDFNVKLILCVSKLIFANIFLDSVHKVFDQVKWNVFQFSKKYVS